jgi:hypothetical protein
MARFSMFSMGLAMVRGRKATRSGRIDTIVTIIEREMSSVSEKLPAGVVELPETKVQVLYRSE